MLSRDHATDDAASLIDSFPCEVEIPARLKDNFERTGYVMSDQERRRRFPRFHCRGEKKRAGLQYQSTLPALPRENSWHNVYLNNISRGGLSFLHSEALYPREQMQMLLPNGKMVSVEIVYCRRVDRRCYDLGAHIVSGDAEGEATDAASN